MMARPSRDDVVNRLERTLGEFVSPINARSVLRLALERAQGSPDKLRSGALTPSLAEAVLSGCRLYVRDPDKYARLTASLRAMTRESARPISPVGVEIRSEQDIVTARGVCRQLADRMGFGHLQQIQVATVVSELARNIVRYAGTGRIRLTPQPGVRARLEILAEDHGPGITDIDEVLSGHYVSRTGLGRGLLGCKEIMDEFAVRTGKGQGTLVRCAKVVEG